MKIVMKRSAVLAAALTAAVLTAAPENVDRPSPGSVWCEKFDAVETPDENGVVLPRDWQVEGGKIGVPMTVCTVTENKELHAPVLVVHSARSTGGIICNLSDKVDLNKTPIMRWRWRVLNLPKGGDGRVAAKDDQPVALYIGTNGGWFKKQSVAYRWECETPKGYTGEASYGGGIVQVHFITLCDKNIPVGEWRTESRNVAADFRKAYGTVPKEFALSVMGNSQYTGSDTKAEIAFIEFLPEAKQ